MNSVSRLSYTSLPLNVKVNAGRHSILGDLLAINQHFKFSHARPLHAAHRLGGFGNGILSGFGEALFGRTHNLDDFLGHGCLLSWNRSISLPKGESRNQKDPPDGGCMCTSETLTRRDGC